MVIRWIANALAPVALLSGLVVACAGPAVRPPPSASSLAPAAGARDDDRRTVDSDPHPIWVLTPVEERQIGQLYRRDFWLSHEPGDSRVQARVDEIGRSLAVHSERPAFPYEFFVYRGEHLQGQSLPGGQIFVSDRAVQTYDDDELAFVIAHELAHSALRHHVSNTRLRAILDPDELQGLRQRPRTSLAIDGAAARMVLSHWHRDLELAADRYGALSLVRADRRLSAAVSAIHILAEHTAGPVEDAQHPPFDLRIRELERLETKIRMLLEVFREGVAALERNRPREAIELFTLFQAEFPRDTAVRINLGSAYLAKRRKENGVPWNLAESLPIVPESTINPRFSFPPTRSAFSRDSGHPDLRRAREQFELALELDRYHPWALAGLALVETRVGRLDAARDRLTLARGQEPESPELALCLGNVEFQDGDLARARTLYEEAQTLHHSRSGVDWPAAHKNLARTFEALGQTDAAALHWCRLLSDHDLASEANDHLRLLGKDCS